jgi:non-ribosomal peptide synthetase component F
VLVLQDFDWINGGSTACRFEDLAVERIRNVSSRVDLSIHMYPNEAGGLSCYLMYQKDLFLHQTMKTFIDVFRRVMNSAITHPTIPIARLPLITPQDLVREAEWNNTGGQETAPGSICERFKVAVVLGGSNIALNDGDSALNYLELDDRADRLASWLLERRMEPEEVVGIVSSLIINKIGLKSRSG